MIIIDRRRNKQLIQDLITKGKTMKEIGRTIGVSRQRIYQLLTKYNIQSPERKKHGFWKNQSSEAKWLWRVLCSKKIEKSLKWELFNHLLPLPTHCPILGIPLDYNNGTPFNREYSPSVDRIDSLKSYEINNVHIISWRANRVKNDGTAEEHRKIANYLLSLKI